MVLSWMLYAVALSGLFGLAALTVESLARQRSWPARWIWVAALSGSLLVPAGALLMPDSTPPSEVDRLEGVVLRDGTSGAVTIALLATFTELKATVSATPALDGWLLLGWATTSGVLVLWMTLSSVTLARRGRSWLSRRVDGREVWVSDDIGPAVVGFFGHRIVMPQWLLEQPTERRLVLRHEEEHIYAGDGKLLGFGVGMLLAFPWNLPLWWQFRRLRHALEVDCDQRVLRAGADRSAYCRTLLTVSSYGMARPVMLAAADSPSMLERRILAMLAPSKARSVPVRAATILLAFAALLVAFRTAPSSPQSPTPRPEGRRPAALLPAHYAIPFERYTEPGFTWGSEIRIEAPVDTPVVPQAAPSAPLAYEVAALDSPPRLANQTVVKEAMERLYEREFSDSGMSGRVVVQFVIDADGRPDPASLRVIQSQYQRLQEPTRELVLQMQFDPGKLRGASVRTLVQIPLSWHAAVERP